MKDETNGKSVRVHCDFCNEYLECPEEMLATAQKQMCFTCFNNKDFSDEELKDIHIDMPRNKIHDAVSSEMVDRMVDEIFPKLWQERKEEFKDLSKKDLAQELFGAGVFIGIKAFLEEMETAEKEEQQNGVETKEPMRRN